MLRKLQNTILLLWVTISISHAQRNMVSGVSIAADTLPPHPSAVLEVRAMNKGILIPRMSNLQKESIANPADGLTVYVTDDNQEHKGLWYYSKPLNTWEHLTPRQPAYPKGAIIMYTGEMGSFDANGKGTGANDGWQICNGLNGAPDLRGRFIAGAAVSGDADYTLDNIDGKPSPEPQSGQPITSAPHNTYIMTEEHLPAHSHNIAPQFNGGINFKHVHSVKGGAHSHSINVMEKKRSNSGYNFMGLDAAKHTNTYNFRPTYASVSINSEADIIKSGQFPPGTVLNAGSGPAQIVPVDNRPPYYVVVYIMKLE